MDTKLFATQSFIGIKYGAIIFEKLCFHSSILYKNDVLIAVSCRFIFLKETGLLVLSLADREIITEIIHNLNYPEYKL